MKKNGLNFANNHDMACQHHWKEIAHYFYRMFELEGCAFIVNQIANLIRIVLLIRFVEYSNKNSDIL